MLEKVMLYLVYGTRLFIVISLYLVIRKPVGFDPFQVGDFGGAKIVGLKNIFQGVHTNWECGEVPGT
jgi:hypothetical protein